MALCLRSGVTCTSPWDTGVASALGLQGWGPWIRWRACDQGVTLSPWGWAALPSLGKCKPPPASLVAQTLKQPPATQDTQVQSLSREDNPEKSVATYSSLLAWRIPWTEEPGRLTTVQGVAASQTRMSN